jgi:hypothetical protein
MPRGGDRRPIRAPQGRDLDYASLLFAAMCEGSSKASKRFNMEREILFLRWERLLRVLGQYTVPGWGGPPSTLDRIENYLEIAAISRSVIYPSPRPLTVEEDRQVRYREAVAGEALEEIYWNLMPSQEGSSNETNQEWGDVTKFFLEWSAEPARGASAHCKKRVSRRTAVQRYRKEVADFCQNWRLLAWWAVPALVQSYFFRIETGYDQILESYVRGVSEVAKFTIVGRIPGTTDEDFELDQNRFSHAMFETVVGSSERPIVVKQRPSRTEMADLEQVNLAACVVIDWDGRSQYWCMNDPEQSITLSEYIVEQCEDRLGRELTKREERELLKQVDPQIAEGRQFFLDTGWSPRGATDPLQQAQWVAQKLLSPMQSWETISGVDADLLPSVIRACNQFAERAMLTLPRR